MTLQSIASCISNFLSLPKICHPVWLVWRILNTVSPSGKHGSYNARLNSYHSSLTPSSPCSLHLKESVDIHYVDRDERLGEHCRGPSIESMLLEYTT
jgi:hypothetical protein